MKGESVDILMAEDDPAHAEAMRRVLEAAGMVGATIRVAGTLGEYRECVAASPPDIALVDLNLPDGRAVEVLTSPPEAGAFPVLVMTSYGNEQTAVEALKSGALDYVVKSPESFAAMPRTIERALREWRLLREQSRAEEKIRQLNAELEQRIRERTAQLEDANRELEAFAYSVSHDLKAPLRGINGFSHILLEEFAPNLPPDAQECLQRVWDAAQHMGNLIDDLLKLSQTTRVEMHCEPVDLSELAHSILRQLQEAQPERQMEKVIASGLVAEGDTRLLRIALENLLRNAWKFTGKTPHARIEVGTSEQLGYRVFFVRDNGAGFDMNYADKLFGAFQRLHGGQEFEGTGIGLAIVQRIIHRHGGKVWAEAEKDKGAKFYFTLGAESCRKTLF
jgi:light-regulated signal transduction histidine kinase (bacteriophytochrome)